MHGIEPRTLSNSELILACDNGWNMGSLPSELQLELFNRFCKLAPLDGFPAIDPRQIPLPL